MIVPPVLPSGGHADNSNNEQGFPSLQLDTANMRVDCSVKCASRIGGHEWTGHAFTRGHGGCAFGCASLDGALGTVVIDIRSKGRQDSSTFACNSRRAGAGEGNRRELSRGFTATPFARAI